MKRILAVLLSFCSFALHADESSIRKTFAERYPDRKVKSVAPTPIPGIFEVYASGQLVYADATASHLLVGTLVDTRTRSNLSQQRLEALKSVKFDSLPFEHAIPIVKGKGERRIAVFSDPDCPFCKQLERELAGIDNLTVHVFPLPLRELHPQAVEVARKIWCSADRAAAWRAYLLEGRAPEGDGACANPVEAVAALAESLDIGGTPAIVLPNGRRIDGALPAARLEALLAAP